MNIWTVRRAMALTGLLIGCVVSCSGGHKSAPTPTNAGLSAERPPAPSIEQGQASKPDVSPPPTAQVPPAPAGFALALPPPAAAKKTRWLRQGWNETVRARAHHRSQGSATFPVSYEWFVALEQPSATPATESPLLIEVDYLSRFGFISSVKDPVRNPHGLPIGFARVAPFDPPIPGSALNPNPATGQPYTAVGFTCAACHTGQLEFKDTRILIDGGPALTNLELFRDALRFSLAGLADGARAQRFMGRILPPDASPAQRAGLKAQLEGFGAAMAKEAVAEVRAAAGRVEVAEGFARLDALARIGNEVFWSSQRRSNGVTGSELDQNYALHDAPVNFPPIWDAPWFSWVQYNGSIMQPMFRNFSEALGVGAKINLGPDAKLQLVSTVDVHALHQIEQDIAGPPPFPKKAFKGLVSPHWPKDILPPIDAKLAKQGALLYKEHCQGCHLPPPGSREFWSKDYWKKDGPETGESAELYLDIELVPLAKIGTDPAQAANLRKRTIQLPQVLSGESGPNGNVVPFSAALKSLSTAIKKAYERADIPEDKQAEFNGRRPNELRADLGYRPRPLNGIWATPPFLHNGSVPTLYLLLSPAAERPRTFYLGSRAFDPTEIGFDYREGEGLFKVDTSIAGNLNTGHEFADAEGAGVIGRALKPEERMALIEYIKTL